MEASNAALMAAGGGAGGLLIGMIVTKLLTRTAASISDLPVLEYRVKVLEEKADAQAELVSAQERELDAVWREFGKAKSWIDSAVELARGKGLELTTPRWGKEP